MADSYAQRRKRAIEDAAFALLIEKGYKTTSMLAVARRARASNETLYKWYGNKQELFRSLVARNLADMNAALDAVLSADLPPDPLDALQGAGATLLALLTSDETIALNRAAAGDVHDTRQLGQALGDAGREAIYPRLAALFERLAATDQLTIDDPGEAALIWLSLLVADIQLRVATGARARPSPEEIAEHSAAVQHLLTRLIAPHRID